MKVIRILNNNIVATLTNDKKEAVVQGSGIGFQKKPGDIIDESKIEKIYIFHDEERAEFEKLLEDTPIEYFQIAQDIANQSSKNLQITLSNKVLISLADHISFAVERKKKNISLPNLMLNEIKILYPQEYRVGVWAIHKIKEELNIELDKDEAGYIAIHIVNAELNVARDKTINILRLCQNVIKIIQDTFNINLNEESLDYSRLLTHLKYLAQRIFTKKPVNFKKNEDMYELLIKKDERLLLCIEKVCRYIQKEFEYECSQEEQVYLMIHLLRVI